MIRFLDCCFDDNTDIIFAVKRAQVSMKKLALTDYLDFWGFSVVMCWFKIRHAPPAKEHPEARFKPYSLFTLPFYFLDLFKTGPLILCIHNTTTKMKKLKLQAHP